ncbi:MAG: hypothetical protein GY788_29385 [bacterium]|nr:hypothetical protein [bacterium]
MSTPHRFRLAADYHCYPTWRGADDGSLENPAPQSLQLPAQLAADLLRWAEVFDQTLDPDDPMSSGFSTDLEHEMFVRWGYALGRAMAGFLHQEVDYFDDLAQEFITLSAGTW